ncbi:MAG: ATP-binding protein [Pseudomonadota bacterium]
MRAIIGFPRNRLKLLMRYLPVLSIVLVAGTLLVIVVLFTVKTISNQNTHIEESASRQGISVIRTLEAGTRTGFMEGEWGVENVQMLIEQAAKDPEVEWVGLISGEGIILAHSDAEKIGLRLLMGKDMDALRTVIRAGEPVSFKRELPDGRTVFEIWKPFTPFRDQLVETELIARHTVIGKELLDVFDRVPKHVLFIGLKMDRFDAVYRRDLLYAVLMGAILFIIGSAGIYFVFVIQNSYLVRRTLEEMRTYTKNVVESMANGLITVDQSMRVASFNPSALEILRAEKDEIEGRRITEVLPLEEEIRQVLSDSKVVLEKEVKTSNGGKGKSFLTLSVSALKEPDSGVSRGAVVILKDLTEIRELEQKVLLNEKFAALGRLSAGIAHEIRNPLNSIRGFIQYFQKKLPMEQEDYSYTELMITEVDRLNRVISKLLAYSKPREPRLTIRSADEILDHCIRLMQREAAAAGVTITIEAQDAEIPLVLMDTDQMTQVFLNILINAVEACAAGGNVVIRRGVTSDGKLVITIRDSGEGIPRENIDKLFDPFFSTKKKGTGLGLAIVKSIIEGHGGEIEVDSETGKGSAFIVTLQAYQIGGEEETLDLSRARRAIE